MTEAQLLADRLRYLSQRPVGLKESLEIVDSLPRIVAMLDLVGQRNQGEIGNAIIAGIADGDTALEKMAAVVDHLRLAGFVIVPNGQGNQGMTDARNLRDQLDEVTADYFAECDKVKGLELKLESVLAAQPRYLTGCLRDGVCRGLCRNTDCPNHDMVVAARVCVFPKEDGVVYPKKENET